MEKKLFEAGAKDVWRSNIAMKKGRMGICLSVLCSETAADAIKRIILIETTAIGLRTHAVEKEALDRDEVRFEFEGLAMRFKRVYYEKELLKYKVEYEDLTALASEMNWSILEAQRRVRAYLEDNERWKAL